jgi:hypothetical protein
VRGIGDVQAAIKTIGHERLPVGADSHPHAFVRELQALGPALEKFSNTSEKLKPNALVAGVDGLKLRLARIGEEAEKAGVRDCRTTRVRLIVPAAVRAPVFAEQFNQLEHRELSRLRKIGFPQVDTPAEYGRALERLAGLLDRSLDGIGRLDPPLWAAQQTADYERALRDLQSAVQAFAAQIEHDHGRPPAEIDLATYRRLYRKIRATGRAETKAHRKMLRAVGAAPTFPPGDGADVEPDSSQES